MGPARARQDDARVALRPAPREAGALEDVGVQEVPRARGPFLSLSGQLAVPWARRVSYSGKKARSSFKRSGPGKTPAGIARLLNPFPRIVHCLFPRPGSCSTLYFSSRCLHASMSVCTVFPGATPHSTTTFPRAIYTLDLRPLRSLSGMARVPASDPQLLSELHRSVPTKNLTAFGRWEND